MNCSMEQKVVLGNNKEYKYIKEQDGKEVLSRNVKIGSKETKIVITSTEDNNSKNIEEYIVNILSELYIKKQLEKFS